MIASLQRIRPGNFRAPCPVRAVDLSAPLGQKMSVMWRAIISLCIAFTIGLPTLCHAQSYDNDRQNPKQYTNDDSQPVRLMAYVLSPLGFALEWGVTRPLHYIATDTFLAPVFGGDRTPETYVPPFPPMEPEAGSPPPQPTIEAALPPTELKPAAPAASKPSEAISPQPRKSSASSVQSSPPAAQSPAPAQPVVH